MSAAFILNDADDLSSLAAYWFGDWSLRREITGYDATMSGMARFTPMTQVNCLEYSERGDLVLKTGDSFDATRRYSFECGKDGVTIYFADGKDKGKIFQNLKPKTAAMFVGTHLCIEDRYDTSYEIIDDNRFISIHRVEGPKKIYVSTTIYNRSPSTL